MIEAVRLVARLEGILLDPVYTGKAMAGLIDLVRRGEISSDQTVVFWHTGGSAALFAYEEIFVQPRQAAQSETAGSRGWRRDQRAASVSSVSGRGNNSHGGPSSASRTSASERR